MDTSRHMTNLQVAKLLRAVAAAIELSSGDNRFRIVAYQRAADAIEHSSSEVKDLWDDGNLKELAGVGEAIAGHLDELFKTGKVKHFEAILKPFPPALFELMEVPGIGPKTALKFSKELGITRAHSAIPELLKAAKKGRIDERFIKAIEEYQGRSRRLLLDVAQTIADSIVGWMRKNPHVREANTLGSLRRQASTVGDIDIAVASDHAKEVIEHFTKYPHKSRVLEAGVHTASLILPNEYQVDLMVQPPAAYGALLQHFTGSKHHNIKLREYALKKGYSLSEYGITPRPSTSLSNPSPIIGEGRKGEVLSFPTEEKFYNFLGLDWIPPELREGENEIELAKLHQLPKLVELSDIRGDLQMHSDFNIEPSHDLGLSSVDELCDKARELGYEYIGITDHNPAVSGHTQAQILDLIKKRTEVIQFQKRAIHVFNSLEIDIQPIGKRALPDAALELLDYACIAIHSSFRLSRKAMTDRVLSALDHPKVKFFAHPTARLLGQREGVELDWDRIFDFCVRNHKWLEIDGWPNRLDLPDVVAKDAIKYGVKLVVDTDSHAAGQLVYMRYGVSVARRAGAAKYDIINTGSLKEVISCLTK
ncbi:MAG: PHP domain/helix-hairpin-helix motif protein [Microgenomates group bacterium GW2011_GWC1_47_20]|uniref:DNA-directed DNA polymerase n=1 Tax=Candidatus Amesbacteria bacterium GW2011_GWC2_45_19 TaxID=1618366 RepID=A0A0G1PD06_9BACT|nr:MAG: PHP domain/helix-hairpin-helix motif protein [Candidatus Amesbacteria bacterium GW2011_GWC2_45_19]KKU68942.1 MAG: PHP domain/helix-hairpin-helix motif protein [Microgenomates group bacterium GW2011_GWC1_47_20]